MRKKFFVRLTEKQALTLKEVVSKADGSGQMLRRANILLAANVDGLNWTDQKIAEAYHCSSRTVEKIRRRFVERGFDETLKARRRSGRPKALSGRQEAELMALRLSEPPKGFDSWSLRLLARKAVELEIVEAASHDLMRRTFKKRLDSKKD